MIGAFINISIKKTLVTFLYAVVAFFIAIIPPIAAQELIPKEKWWQDLNKKATKAGVSEKTVRQSLAVVEWPVEKILQYDRNQSEHIEGFWIYIQRRIDKKQIEQGRKMLEKHRDLLNRVEKKYGVEPRYITAFWGMETRYGEFIGSFNTLAATATLSLDKRRSAFFQKELVSALVMIEKGYIEPQNMISSWAGAMGHMQFLPSTALAYAVDGDGDGRIDLHHSIDDALFSAANFLKQIGWQKNAPCGYEVIIPADFNFSKTGLNRKKTLEYWRDAGVKPARKEEKHQHYNKEKTASLVIPAGFDGPAFLIFGNFKRILLWNRSLTYALSVCHLAHRLDGGLPLHAQSPNPARPPLSIEDIHNAQSLLRQAGYRVGPSDGIIGSKTRNALQKWQKKQKIPADGYLNHKILQKLKQQAGK